MSPTSAQVTVLAAIALPIAAGLVAYALGGISRAARDWLVVLALAGELGLALRIARDAAARPFLVPLVDAAASPTGVGFALSVGGISSLALAMVALVWLATG